MSMCSPMRAPRPGIPERGWPGFLSTVLALVVLALLAACGGGSPGPAEAGLAITTAPAVTAGQTNCQASVQAVTNATYAWTLSNGTLTGGQGSPSITYTAGQAGTTRLTVTVRDPGGASREGQATVRVLAAPSIASFTPARATVTAGQGTTLTAVFQDGTGSVSQLGAIASGTPLATGALAASATYTLTVTNSLGATATAQATVTVVAAPAITGFSAARATLTCGETTTLAYAFSGGTGRIDGGVGPVASGGSSAIAPTASTAYTLTVTNAAGDAATAQVPVTVVPAPAITGFGATRATLTAGQGTTLTAVFSNGTGTVSNLGAIASGTPLATGALAASTTYTLTVTNSLGATATAQATVTVVAAPAITGFSAARAALTCGETTTLAYAFSGGTGRIDGGVGPVASGGSSTVAPTASTTYTLTVTNAAGDATTAQAPVTVLPAPAITSFGATRTPLTVGEGTTLAAVFSNGTGTVSNLGAIASGTPLATGALAASTTYTLTVTNSLGATATAQATVTVVAAPSIGSFAVGRSPLTAGHGTILSYTFSDGTGRVDQSVGPVTSGGSSNIVPTADTTYTLTVTNAAGAATTAQASVTLVPAATISRFTAADPAVDRGGATTLTAAFDHGTAVVTGSAQTVSVDSATLRPTVGSGPAVTLGHPASGDTLGTGALAAATTYTLTVANALGDPTTATVTVPLRSIFTPTGLLTTPRANHTATLLGTGKVLVAGGNTGSSDSVGLALAEIYDPATGTFTPTRVPMTTPRISHTATLLPDGTVLLAGGAAQANAEIYDPATDSFTSVGPMVALRRGHTASLLADAQGHPKVLLAGGYDIGNHGWALASAEIYDPMTRTFTATGPLGVAREGHRATVLEDGSVLVTGGDYLASAERYRLDQGTFVGVGAMATARANHSATLLADGEVLLAGGWNASVTTLATGETYGPGSYSSTSPTGSMAGPRFMHTATLMADGSVLVLGGWSTYLGNDPLGRAECFDPGTRTFALTSALSPGRYLHTATLLPNGGVLVIGGTDDTFHLVPRAEIYR